MKKLLAAIFAGLFAISVTAPVVAQDKKEVKKAAKKEVKKESKKEVKKEAKKEVKKEGKAKAEKKKAEAKK